MNVSSLVAQLLVFDHYCENYTGILISFITHCFLLLACFCVGIVYIPVKNLIFYYFNP